MRVRINSTFKSSAFFQFAKYFLMSNVKGRLKYKDRRTAIGLNLRRKIYSFRLVACQFLNIVSREIIVQERPNYKTVSIRSAKKEFNIREAENRASIELDGNHYPVRPFQFHSAVLPVAGQKY